MPKKRIKKYNTGVSLIELIVAIAVFTVAMVIGAGVVLSILTAQDKAISAQIVGDNMSFALEVMSREIRTGTFYHCGIDSGDYDSSPRNCEPDDPPIPANGGPSLTFINALDQTVMYRVNGSGRLEKTVDGIVFLPITASDVNIERITFYVSGAESTDDLQPMVIISMSATVGEKFVSEINLQTTMTQRSLDF